MIVTGGLAITSSLTPGSQRQRNMNLRGSLGKANASKLRATAYSFVSGLEEAQRWCCMDALGEHVAPRPANRKIGTIEAIAHIRSHSHLGASRKARATKLQRRVM
jgi:hypothetical protein